MRIQGLLPGALIRFSSFVIALLLNSCQNEGTQDERAQQAASQTPLFRLISPETSGVHFINPLQENALMNIFLYDAYYSGGGVAIGDVNGDYLPDLYFTGNLVPNRLFINEGNLQFKEVSQQAGVMGSKGWTTGCVMADVNGDGLLDIYVCKSGKLPEEQRRNELFINRGDGTFTESAARFGLDDPGYSMHAIFFDYDGDNDLDCYLINYPVEAFNNFYVQEMRNKRDPFSGDKLLRNDGGRFVDVSEEAGISGSPIGFSQSAAVHDFNQDGWPDIFVSTDFTEHDLYYINQGDGTFRELLSDAFAHTSHFSMGNDAQDINRDGWPDLVVLDMLPEDNYRQKTLLGPHGYDKYQLQVEFGFHRQQMRNTLHLNDGDGRFREVAQLAGISNTDWSWSALLADFDNDAWMDLYITNGFRRDYTNLDFLKYDVPAMRAQAEREGREPDLGEMVRQLPEVRIPNYCFRNLGNGRFENTTRAWGLEIPSFSNGAAYADLDGDGDLDLVVNNIDAKAFIFENTSPAGTNWLRVQLNGPPRNRFGTGAQVSLITRSGLLLEQMMMPNRGFLSSVEPILHFGLGAEEIDQISVRWPDGRVQHIPNPGKTRRRIALNYDEAVSGEWPRQIPPALFKPQTAPVWQHRENDFIDFKTEPLIPHFCSTQGPIHAAWPDASDQQPSLIYIGGSMGFKGALFSIDESGQMKPMQQELLQADAGSEDGGAVWLDVNQDGHIDLYISSGTYECPAGDQRMVDRLYLADGKGGFLRAQQDLSFTGLNVGSSPASADFDQDGYPDLFVGGRVVPGAYGQRPQSWLLRNDQGTLKPVELPAQPSGLVTAAIWADLNNDDWPDLIVAGEWMPIHIYYNDRGVLQMPHLLPNSSGWWYSLKALDLDGDGQLDLIAGNRGWNAQMQASPEKPVRMYVADFDGNGQTEPIITYFIDSIAYPMASRDDLLDQVNTLKKRYTRYSSYGHATYESIFSPEERQSALEYKTETFSSGVFRNRGKGRFEFQEFPAEAQVAPIWGIAPKDLNADGLPDLVLTGNLFDNRVQEGSFNASRGVVLFQNKDESWTALRPAESGLFLRGDTRACLWIGSRLLILNNQGPLQIFQYVRPKS